MPRSGFTGISFPFRITSRGGVAMSTTSSTDPTHIAESIIQILSTDFLERPMEGHEVFSSVSLSLFDRNDASLQGVLKSRIVESITKLDERVDLDEGDIDFVIEEEDGVEYLIAYVTYRILVYNTSYTSKVKVGELHE